MRMSRIRNNRKGFTLAEVLIVAAIIVVLAGVSTVAVFRYQRSLKQLELDGIAKEIFVAAQNHLTMAESQGYLGKTKFGVEETAKDDKNQEVGTGIFYFIVGGSSTKNETTGNYPAPEADQDTVLSVMLPFASVDETVRLGGSYVVRYQKDPGIVLDVFYVEKNGRYPYTTLGSTDRDEGKTDYSLLMSEYKGDGKKSSRRDAGDFEHAVLGWYGGDQVAALPTGAELDKPTLAVFNEETLRVEITNPNVGTGHDKTGLKLVVKGLTSGKSKEIPLVTDGTFDNTASYVSGDVSQITVILDDITNSSSQNHHFAAIFGGDGLIPGENIEIYAVAYNNKQITDSRNGQSESHYTNSLFAYDGNGSDLTADIGYIRHLENLEEDISGLNVLNLIKAKDPTHIDYDELTDKMTATQTADLSWTGATIKYSDDPTANRYWTGVKITRSSDGVAIYSGSTFVPVSPDYTLHYQGEEHSLSNFVIQTGSDNAGLFGALESYDKVSDLELIDFTVSGTDAGALAGTSAGTITNVLARNSSKDINYTIQGSGNAGGLVGSLTAGGRVEKCVAAVYVKSSAGGSAGGLIGSATDGTVTASYSGGHTNGGEYKENVDDQYRINVQAPGTSGVSGGLIGTASGTAISSCYSTCSASGATAGGLVGSASAGSAENCYATGLVKGTTNEGAFVGSLSGTTLSACRYYKIINERSDSTTGGYKYLVSVGGADGETANITPLDEDADTFNGFVQVWYGGGSTTAFAYDGELKTRFNNKYDLKTVKQLGYTGTVDSSDFVASHYGDWPSPEIWVINTPGGSTGGGSGGSAGGGTDPSASSESYPVNAYFYPILKTSGGMTINLADSNYVNMFTPNLPPEVGYESGKGFYFKQTTQGPVELKFTYTGGISGYTTWNEEITVSVKGVDIADAFTYKLVLGSEEAGKKHYTINFTNNTNYLMRKATVTIPSTGTGTITSFEGNVSGWVNLDGSVTLEYAPWSGIPGNSTTDNVAMTINTTDSFGLETN